MSFRLLGDFAISACHLKNASYCLQLSPRYFIMFISHSLPRCNFAQHAVPLLQFRTLQLFSLDLTASTHMALDLVSSPIMFLSIYLSVAGNSVASVFRVDVIREKCRVNREVASAHLITPWPRHCHATQHSPDCQ